MKERGGITRQTGEEANEKHTGRCPSPPSLFSHRVSLLHFFRYFRPSLIPNWIERPSFGEHVISSTAQHIQKGGSGAVRLGAPPQKIII